MFVYRVEFRASVVEYLSVGGYNKAANIGPYSNQAVNFQGCPNSFRGLREIGLLGFEHFGQHRRYHPAPQEDHALIESMENAGVRYEMHKFHFGFATLNQFRRWFDVGNRQRMAERGFWLAVYDVEPEDAHIGSTQCVFDMKAAALVSYMELEEI
ncbi:hypothetical protein [Serratia phage SP1]|nr:hypothetical protein [Serratia phage SP1]